MFRPLLIAAALLAFNTTAYAEGFKECLDFFPQKTPPRIITTQPDAQRDLCFSAFAILHSGQSKTPLYVVQKLNKAVLIDAKDEERTNKFYEEARLPSRERSKLSDFKGSGLSRGHMAPAADQPTPEAMAQSFSLANMVPQSSKLNSGQWARRVEKATRDYVMRAQGDVYIFTGPVFHNKPIQTIGDGKVWVPSHLYKLVYDATTKRAWAFWAENLDTADIRKPITYQELVSRVGIEFLPSKPAD